MEHQFAWTLTKEGIESLLGRTITDDEFLGVVENLKVSLPYEAFAFASWRAYEESISPTPDPMGFLLPVTLEEALNTSRNEFKTIVSRLFEEKGLVLNGNVEISPITIDGDRVVYLIAANSHPLI